MKAVCYQWCKGGLFFINSPIFDLPFKCCLQFRVNSLMTSLYFRPINKYEFKIDNRNKSRQGATHYWSQVGVKGESLVTSSGWEMATERLFIACREASRGEGGNIFSLASLLHGSDLTARKSWSNIIMFLVKCGCLMEALFLQFLGVITWML